jgi:hypothetical protein
MKTAASGIALVLALAFATACSRASESSDAKRSPKPPPAESVAVPAGLHVDVEIDGAPAAPIDAARLAGIKPDFSDDEHRAWRVATILGPAAMRPGVVVAAVGDRGVSVEMRAGPGPSDPTPALLLNRRGEVVVGMLAPGAPFPVYHGNGGRLGRPGDPLPHVAGPTKLRIYLEGDTGAPAHSANAQ